MAGEAFTIEIGTIEAALDGLLKAAIEADLSNREAGKAIDIKLWTLDEIEATSLPTRAESLIEDMARNPIGSACRMGIRHCGKMLFKIGGQSLMREVCDRVAEMVPEKVGYRATLMDKNWDGIGGVWWS